VDSHTYSVPDESRADGAASVRYIFVYNIEITTLENGEVFHNGRNGRPSFSLSIFHEQKNWQETRELAKPLGRARALRPRARKEERLSERQYPAHGSGFKH
jgi:hypothetical protein